MMKLASSLLAVRMIALCCSSALVFAGFATGCKKANDETVTPLVTVQAANVEVGEIAERIMADAILAPLAQAAIAPKISSPVKTFYVQRGSKVKAGQLLAVLENRDLTAQTLDSKGQYIAAQASYDMQTKAQVPEDYAKAQLDVAQARAQLHLQDEIVASRRKLFEQGAIAGHDLDTASTALTQAQVAYDAAQNHLRSLEKVSRQAALTLAQGQLASAKGKYQAAEAQVFYSEIRSPIAGVVTDRPLFAGETATPGAPLITVMDTSALLAKVHIAQTVAQRLSLGDSAEVMVPGVEGPIDAKVSLISPAVDPGSTTVEIWLRVENAQGKYKAGTPVRLAIRGMSAEKAIKVPMSAVVTSSEGAKQVMVIGTDDVAHVRAVTVGINDGTDVQIVTGLNGSERVVAQGAYGLEDGTKIKVGKDGDEKGADKN